MKKIVFLLLLTNALRSEILIPSERASLKDFENYIKSSEFIPYTEFRLQLIKDSDDFSEKILNSADNWLTKDSSYLQINKEIRQLQNEKFLKNSERRLLFNLLEKKIQQTQPDEALKYYTAQACWIYANDKEIKSEFSQFEDYCQLKKLTTLEIRRKFPEYKYIITDGNIISLKSDTSLFYNDVPQKIELLSDKKMSVHFYGTIDSFIKKMPLPGDSIVKGKKDNYESKDLDQIDSYKIYFSDKKIASSVKETFFDRTLSYIHDNKYEIISASIIVLAGAYYMKDKTLKFENTNSLNIKTHFSF